MAYGNEADEIRGLGMLLKKGYIFRGLKPVNWCFDCGSALAEAEVEYEDRKDPAVDVGFRVCRAGKDRKGVQSDEAFRTRPGFAVIWTTTPWTLPGNQALNVHPDFDYALVETDRGLLIVADAMLAPGDVPEATEEEFDSLAMPKLLAKYGIKSWRLIGKAKGKALENIRFRHPFYDRTVAGLPRRLRDARYRHRDRAFGAGLRRGGLRILPPLRHEGRRDPHAGDGRRQVRRLAAAVRRAVDLGCQSEDRASC